MDVNSHGRGKAAPARFAALLLTFIIVSAFVFPVVLGLGMTRGLNHDEHQHVAAGALILREGLLPYRDFPYFHTPYLPFAYALLFGASDHLLISARLLSVLCASAVLGIIGTIGYHLFRERGRLIASSVCAGTVLLALTTALFTESSGRAWNNEPSLLLVLLAFGAHVAGLNSSRLGWFVLSGVLLGLGIGTRITYAPLLAPFGLALMLYPAGFRWPWKLILSFSGGLLVGLAGVLYFFATVPEQAFYANFGFAKTNIVYRFSTGEPRTMTLLTKLRFFFKLIIRPDAALFAAGLLPVLAAYFANRGTPRHLRFELRFILLLLPFLLIGSFAPSPLFDQYFYPLVPFLLLSGLYAGASIPVGSLWLRRTTIVGALAVMLSVAMGAEAFEDARKFFVPTKWHGVELHRRAEKLRAHMTEGRVLTLAPIYPLEAGLKIYPSFSTGPFAWRVSPYIEPTKAVRLQITTPLKLEPALNAVPPGGILLGFEEEGEEPLADYARKYGYEPVKIHKSTQLWIRRLRSQSVRR